MEYQQVLLILMITELGGTLKTHILLLSVFSLFACGCLLACGCMLDLGFLPDLGFLLQGQVFGFLDCTCVGFKLPLVTN